jgi:hypothetical protein
MSEQAVRRLFVAAASCVLLASATAAAQGTGNAYDRGYREGVRQGEQDGRQGRERQIDRNTVYRNSDLGAERRYGSRDVYRDDVRRGFSAGYRVGYDRFRIAIVGQDRRDDRRSRPPFQRGYQDPAFARGYSDGWEKGLDDGRDRDRYEPVRHKDYRQADDGYSRAYGSKDVYKNNYRAGFRQGYEDGYRGGVRGRR